MKKQLRIYSLIFIGLLMGVIFANRGFAYFLETEALANPVRATSFMRRFGSSTEKIILIKNLWEDSRCRQSFASFNNSKESEKYPAFFTTKKKLRSDSKSDWFTLGREVSRVFVATNYSLRPPQSTRLAHLVLDSSTPRAP